MMVMAGCHKAWSGMWTLVGVSYSDHSQGATESETRETNAGSKILHIMYLLSNLTHCEGKSSKVTSIIWSVPTGLVVCTDNAAAKYMTRKLLTYLAQNVGMFFHLSVPPSFFLIFFNCVENGMLCKVYT